MILENTDTAMVTDLNIFVMSGVIMLGSAKRKIKKHSFRDKQNVFLGGVTLYKN